MGKVKLHIYFVSRIRMRAFLREVLSKHSLLTESLHKSVND
jgi:hypothetical protein